jgi:carbamoyl-phosphate synthase/aspartate carbamoyltransferase/dihydroorotase
LWCASVAGNGVTRAQGDDASIIPFEDPNHLNLVSLVSTKEARVYNKAGKVKVLMVDVGMKNNQLRCLIKRGACVKVRHVAVLC